jgi:hypothetical protein
LKTRLNLLLLVLAVVASPLAEGCGHQIDSPDLSAGTPSAAAGQPGPATPDLLCVEHKTSVTLTGDGFTPMPSKTLESTVRLLLPSIVLTRTKDVQGGAVAEPGIKLPDDPANPAASQVRWLSEQQMAFDVTPELKAAPGVYDITVTNPDGAKTATFAGALAGFGRATLSAIAPDILCDADGDQTVKLTGVSFLQVGNALPIVRVGTMPINATKVDGCQPVPGNYAEGPVSVCTSATFTIAKGALPAGNYDVALQNPGLAACDFSEPISLTIVPPPAVTAITEDLVCDAQAAQTMTVAGTGFVQIGTALPSVTVMGTGTSKTYPATAEGCTPVIGKLTETPVTSCTTLKFVVPTGDLPSADYQVVVKNPAPADCVSTDAVYFHVAPPPSLTAAGSVQACDAQGAPVLTVQSGSATGDFLRLTDATGKVTYPTVKVNGMTYAATSAMGCTEIKLPNGAFREGTVEECTSISYTLPQASLASGTFDVTVENPAPAACSGTGMSELVVVPPPTVTSIVPNAVCVGGGDLTINGSSFIPSATVSFTDPAGVQPTFSGTKNNVNAAGTQLTTTVAAAVGNPGTVYDVTVTDPGGCADPAPHQKVTVTSGPVLYFVDPNVVYNGANTAVTLYVTTITGGLPATKVVLTAQVGGATITYTPGDATHPVNAVPGHPNRVQIVVPAGTAAGAYDVTFSDALGCPAQLVGGLTVTATKTITLKNVLPPFGAAATQTPVTIFRDAAAPAPNNVAFKPTPRAFLNKHNAGATDVAIQLGSVAYVDGATLTAIVPANQAVGAYDLIVINPSPTNEVGFLPNAFTVTTAPPPTVSSVTPASIVNATGQAVVVSGANFRAGAVVTVPQCTTAVGGAAPAANGVVTGALNCTGPTCTLAATIDASNLAAGDVCILHVANTDGTFVDFSAIGVTNSSLNLSTPRAGTPMNFARRALVGAAANATSAARFVYAIGGDDGATPYKSVEAAAVDPFGAIKAWTVQPYDLGTARSFAAGVTVGNYIYLCGGSDGTNALASCKRALVLSPTEAPDLQVSDITLAATGLAPGYWYYRVSAIFGSGDADNPSGESLPSEEVIVLVPTIGAKKIQIQLGWSAPVDSLGAALPNVTGYRVYRTAMVNGTSGQEVLLADNVPGTSFVDDASKASGTATPLPLGSTGQWAALPTMGAARKGLAMTSGVDPTNPLKTYVYSFFGMNATTTNNSYEYLAITTQANGHQTVSGAWTTGASTTTAPRWQAGAWRVDSTVYGPAGTSTYVYVGGGLTAAGASANTVEAGKIAAGGDLGTLVAGAGGGPVRNFGVEIAGYGVLAANNQLYTFGGVGGAPAKNAKSAKLASPQPALASGAWNDEGLSTIDPLYLEGSAVQSAFVFLLGGEISVGPPIVATKNTETVVW